MFFFCSRQSLAHTHTHSATCDCAVFRRFFFRRPSFFRARHRVDDAPDDGQRRLRPTCRLARFARLWRSGLVQGITLSLSLSISFSFSISLIQLDFGRSMERAVRLSDVPVWFFLFWLSHFPMTSRHQPLRIKQTKKLPSVSLTTVRKKTNKNKTLSSSRPDCHFALKKKKAVSISEADLARHLTGFETAIFFLSTDFSARTSSAGLCAFFCFLFTSFDGRSNRVPFLFFFGDH